MARAAARPRFSGTSLILGVAALEHSRSRRRAIGAVPKADNIEMSDDVKLGHLAM